MIKPFVIRCGTPDCEWGYKMHDMGEDQLRLCYSEFRKHCMQRHGLQEWDTRGIRGESATYWGLLKQPDKQEPARGESEANMTRRGASVPL